MRVLGVPDASACRAQSQTKPVSARTGGAKYVVVGHSGSGARGGSGCGRSQRLKNRMELLLTILAR